MGLKTPGLRLKPDFFDFTATLQCFCPLVLHRFQGFLEFLEALWELLGAFLEAPGGSLEALRESIFEQPSRVFGPLLHVFVRRREGF